MNERKLQLEQEIENTRKYLKKIENAYDNEFETKIIVVENDRILSLTLNKKDIQLVYPKVHPYTKQRIYKKGHYWTWKHNQLTVVYDTFFDTIDKEYTEIMENGYLVYDISFGWTPKGYYWFPTTDGMEIYKIIEEDTVKRRRTMTEEDE